MGMMLFFAVIMFLAAFTMIRSSEKDEGKEITNVKYGWIAIEGLIVGLVTGLVGAGGGFLIVPALVILVGLPMKKAVGTSLFIVSLKSLIGFMGDLGSGQTIDWNFLLLFTLFSVVGVFIGIYLNKFIGQRQLKKAFGYFVLAMGIFIFVKEIWL